MSPAKLNIKIDTIPGIFIIILLIQQLISCKDEKTDPRTYPRVRTNPVSNISEKGATFNAEIFSMGSEPILEHGFVWGLIALPTIIDNKVLLGPEQNTGIFSAEISSTLSKDVKYSVRSFVQSEEHIFYGTAVSFTSLGSGTSEIFDFKPDSATWNDTIIIYGRNFSFVPDENIVRLGQMKCETISCTDTSLRFILNAKLSEISTILNVELAGNITAFNAKKFKLKTPVLNDFYPKQARWGDTLFITGKYLSLFSSGRDNGVRLGNFVCPNLGMKNDSTILVRVPSELDTETSDLSIIINCFNLSHKQPFILQEPYFEFSPAQGTWESKITLKGKFNNSSQRSEVYLNKYKTPIESISSDSIVVNVPVNFYESRAVITYKSLPFNVQSADSFLLFPPVIDSFSPLAGVPGTTVTIKGDYFGNPAYNDISVRFGDLNASFSYYSNTKTLVAYVPVGYVGPLKINLIVNSQSCSSSEDFTITKPFISSVFPLTGTFNDEITITGEWLKSDTYPTEVLFVDYFSPGTGGRAEIVNSTEKMLIVKVPTVIDSVPKNIIVNIGLVERTSTERFILSPPAINTVTPAVLTAGQTLTLSGVNFNPDTSGNLVFWGPYQLTVLSSARDQITALIASDIPAGTNKIKVIIGGYTRYSSEYYELK